MKPEFLKEMGLNEEQITKICAENDKEVSAAKGTGEQDAAKLKALEGENTALKEQIAEANKAIEGFRGVDAESLNAQIADWKQKYDQSVADNAAKEAERDAKLAQMELDTAVKEALTAAKARDHKSIKGHLDFDTIKLKDGKLFGLTEQLDRVKADHDYLFTPEQASGAGFRGTPPTNDADAAMVNAGFGITN